MEREVLYLKDIKISGKCELWNPFWERTVSDVLDCIAHRNAKRINDHYNHRTLFIIFWKEDNPNFKPSVGW